MWDGPVSGTMWKQIKTVYLSNYPLIYSEQTFSEISYIPVWIHVRWNRTCQTEAAAAAEASLCDQQCVFCRSQADGVAWLDDGGWMDGGLCAGWGRG